MLTQTQHYLWGAISAVPFPAEFLNWSVFTRGFKSSLEIQTEQGGMYLWIMIQTLDRKKAFCIFITCSVGLWLQCIYYVSFIHLYYSLVIFFQQPPVIKKWLLSYPCFINGKLRQRRVLCLRPSSKSRAEEGFDKPTVLLTDMNVCWLICHTSLLLYIVHMWVCTSHSV